MSKVTYKSLWWESRIKKHGSKEAVSAEMAKIANQRKNPYIPKGFKDTELARRAQKISASNRKNKGE
jgi:hypothetical protein